MPSLAFPMSQSVGVGSHQAGPAEMSFLRPTCASHRDREAGPGWPEELAKCHLSSRMPSHLPGYRGSGATETPPTQDRGGPKVTAT